MTMSETVNLDDDYGIKIDKVSKEHLQSVLRDLNDPAASERDTGKLVAAARALFATVAYKKSLGTCDNCGGKSPDSLDACAFCGLDGGVLDKPKETQEANGNGSATAGRPAVGTTLVRTKTKLGTPPKPAEEVVEAKAEVVVAQVRTKGQTKTEEDLDQAERRMHILKAEGSIALWKLGAEIALIHGKQLWKLRTKEVDGKRVRAFTSFDEWCLVGIGMTHGNAFHLLELSKHYDEQQVRLFGTEKLTLLLGAPEESKPALMKEMEQGQLKTVRDVRRKVRAERVKAGTFGKPRDTGRKKMPQPKKRRTSDKITVAMAKKAIRLHFVTRKTMKHEEPKFAKRIADAPVVKIDLGKTTVWISLAQNNKGNIVGTMVAKREA